MAVQGAPGGDRQLVAGFALGLAAALFVLLVALAALGYVALPKGNIPTYPPDVAEPRGTAVWPFRDEWLTPRPRA